MIEPCACIKETAEFDLTVVVASTVILVDMIILEQM